MIRNYSLADKLDYGLSDLSLGLSKTGNSESQRFYILI
jgi:hypothetical protein